MFKQKTTGRNLNLNRFLPSPLNGLDFDNPAFSMPEASARSLWNFIVTPEGLITRPGSSEYVTGFTQSVDSLHVYAAQTGVESLWAACNNGIFNATSPGAVGAAAISLTNGDAHSVQISTGAVSYLFLVNGTDNLRRYDGTTWTSIAALGTATNLFSLVALYRQRLFFVKKNSLEIEYLAPNAITGTTINYPLAATFSLGGKITGIIPWTIDSGTGPEDNLIIITDQGQIAVFNGNDPAIWVLRGVYAAPKPIGSRPLVGYGGDVLVLTEAGVIPVSSLVQSTSIDRVRTITQTILSFFNSAARLYAGNYGWQVIPNDIGPYVLVNVPDAGGVSYQGVMHSQTMAWSVWDSLNARAWARLDTYLYFSRGSGGSFSIRRLDPLLAADAGVSISCRFTQAFSRWGYPATKLSTAIKPYFITSDAFSYTLGIAYDLRAPAETTNITVTVPTPGLPTVIDAWQVSPDNYSTWKSLDLRIVTLLSRVTYNGSDTLYVRGGNF